LSDEAIPSVVLDNDAVWDAVLPRLEQIVRSGRFVLGTEVDEFEADAAEAFGCPWAVGTSSGTAALLLALRAAGLRPGARVGVPANTFFATFEAVVAAGYLPVVLDVGEDHVLAPESAAAHQLDAVVPVHLFGLPVDMPRLLEAVSGREMFVLEDCAQAHGAAIDGRPVGSFGDVGGFSAYPTKNLGAWGDAGFATGSDPHLRDAIRALRHHGQRTPNVHGYVAGTYRLDTIQALVLSEKLRRLAGEVERRRTVASWYRHALADLDLHLPGDAGGRTHAYHQFVVRVPHRDQVRTTLQAMGVSTGVHYPTPVHLQPGAAGVCEVPARPVVAEALADEVLSLPMYPGLTSQQVDRVAASLTLALRERRSA